MESRLLSIPAKITRALLAVVCVMSNLFHAGGCCCASPPCGISQGEERCCAVEANKGCCCQQSPDVEIANSACCCSQTSQQSSAGCQGTCRCSASPLTEGIIAAPQRILPKQDQKTWLADFMPLVRISTSNASVELRPQQQCPGDPRAHNLRQSILCVWRN